MVIFLDTSAIYALADRDDSNHPRAKQLFAQAAQPGVTFLLHNYILAESSALLTRRLGRPAALRFLNETKEFKIRWIDEALHQDALLKWKTSPAKVSFVDQVSFMVIREAKTKQVFAFDDDFRKEGFEIYSPQ